MAKPDLIGELRVLLSRLSTTGSFSPVHDPAVLEQIRRDIRAINGLFARLDRLAKTR